MTKPIPKPAAPRVPHIWRRAGVRADGSVRQSCVTCGTLTTQPEAKQCCAQVRAWQTKGAV